MKEIFLLSLFLFPQEIELEELHLAVVAMECFMLAKLANLDPGYITQTDFIPEPSP